MDQWTKSTCAPLRDGVFHNDVHILQTSSGVSKIKRGLRALFGGGPWQAELV